MKQEEARMMMKRIKDEALFTLDELADLAGVSRHTLYSWSVERRTPSDDALLHLADALDAKAKKLRALARATRKLAPTE
jgi:DNA-binding XRE family transcriptional regulator